MRARTLGPVGLVVLLAAVSLAPLASAWTPPPAELADVTPMSWLRVVDAGWAPADGPARNLLDLLPAGSPAAGDYNGDGIPDVFVPAATGSNASLAALRAPQSRLFLNDGASLQQGTFRDVTDVAGLGGITGAYAASWADYDNDGGMDLLVGGAGFARLFHNQQDGTFREVTASAGIPQGGLVLGGAWGDFDRDGNPDLLLVRFTPTPVADALPAPDFSDVPGVAGVLLRNNGDGTFRDVSAAAGMGSLARRWTSASWMDVDNDGWPDAYVTSLGQGAALWHNDGDGTFTELAAQAGLADSGQATCQAWEDFDNDGLPDAYVAHQDGVSDSLFRNNGDGTFTDLAGTLGLDATAPGRGWGCAALDYEGDGDMDVFVAHGGLGNGTQRSLLLMNQLDQGNGLSFVDQTLEAGDHDINGYQALGTIATPRATSGALALDWNLDGATDLITASHGGDQVRTYANIGYAGGWIGGNGNFLKLWLQGTASPRDGAGAVVTVQAGTLRVTRVVGAGMSWGGASLAELQFGLNKGENENYAHQNKPVSVTVRWPDGHVDAWPTLFAATPSGVTARLVEGGAWQNDTVAPQATLSTVAGDEGASGWFTSPDITVQLTASDLPSGGSLATGVARLRYSLDGATWSSANPNLGADIAFHGQGTHKLWVEAVDKAGNRAVTLYPVRIDATPPTAALVAPAPGSVSAQGRALASPGDPAGVDQSIVVAPVATDLAPLGDAGVLVQGALGSDGTQPVGATASDATSGVAHVTFELLRANGAVAAGATLDRAPYAWAWPAGEVAAGSYQLRTTAVDVAGNPTVLVHHVTVVPSGADGAQATVRDGPSLPGT